MVLTGDHGCQSKGLNSDNVNSESRTIGIQLDSVETTRCSGHESELKSACFVCVNQI